MCLSNPSCFPFSLSTARLQKMESIIRGTGNCPHFCCRQKPMFWLLLCKLSSVIQEGFKAGENGMALFFPMTTTNLRILWVFCSVVCCYFIDRTPPPFSFWNGQMMIFCLIFDRAHIDVKALHWMIIISLPKWKGRWAILLTLVARTLDENNLEMLVWMEIIFTCKQYFPDWSTLMCKLRIKWLFGRLSSW